MGDDQGVTSGKWPRRIGGFGWCRYISLEKRERESVFRDGGGVADVGWREGVDGRWAEVDSQRKTPTGAPMKVEPSNQPAEPDRSPPEAREDLCPPLNLPCTPPSPRDYARPHCSLYSNSSQRAS